MKQLIPYLIFSGNCKEALAFYKHCLNGEIMKMQTYAESPLTVADEYHHRIFDADFRAGAIRFKASDDMPGNDVSPGSNFALFVTFADQSEQEAVFGKLSKGGKELFPLENHFGMFVDKFGMQWMVSYSSEL